MDHRKHFLLTFWILRHSHFALYSFGYGKELDTLMGLHFTSPERFQSNFQKKTLSKQVNLDGKNSPHSEKKVTKV